MPANSKQFPVTTRIGMTRRRRRRAARARPWTPVEALEHRLLLSGTSACQSVAAATPGPAAPHVAAEAATPLPVLFQGVAPSASLVRQARVVDLIDTGVDDEFTFDLDAGQTIAAVLDPDPALRPGLTLSGPDGLALVTTAAAAPGIAAILQAAPATVPGTYALAIHGLDATGGPYALRVVLNAAVEQEAHGGPSNDDPHAAQDLDASFIALGIASAERGAVLGVGDGPDGAGPPTASADHHRFSLQDGQTATVALMVHSSQVEPLLELFDGTATTRLALGVSAPGHTQIVRNFVDPTTDGAPDTYIVGVNSGDAAYTMTITRGADLEAAAGGGAPAIQDLTPAPVALGYLGVEALSAEMEPNDDGVPEVTMADLQLANDWRGSFERIALNSYKATLTGVIDPDREANVDIFRIQACVCDQLTLILELTGPGLPYARLQLLDDSGHRIALDESVFEEAWIKFSQFPYTGDYYVVVDAFDDAPWWDLETSSSSRRSYTLTGRRATGARPGYGVNDDDHFVVAAEAGDTLRVQTATPAAGPFPFGNGLDPALELSDPHGVIVAHANVAGDELLLHTTTVTGNYTVRLFDEGSGGGPYVVGIQGHSSAPAPFRVAASDPPDGSRLPATFRTITVHFNDAVRVDSLDVNDLLLDGLPAGATPTAVDGDTVAFAFPSALPDGEHVISLGAGSVSDLQSTSLMPYAVAITIVSDGAGPRVIGSSIQEGDTIAADHVAYEVRFDEALDPDVLDAGDVRLTGDRTGPRTATDFVYDPGASVATVTFDALEDDRYTLVLTSGDGAFEDDVGNDLDGEPAGNPIPPDTTGDGIPGGDFVVRFHVDIDQGPLPPLAEVPPLGGLVHRTSTAGSIGPADRDVFTIALDASQRFTIVVEPDGALQPAVEVRDPDGVPVGQTTAQAPGRAIVLPSLAAESPGTYRIRVSGASDTTGAYTIDAVLNATVEQEAHGGTANDDPRGAQDLDAGFHPLGIASAEHGAVLGSGDGPGSADWYRLSLNDGSTLTLLAQGLSASDLALALFDDAGTWLAAGTTAADGAVLIADFVDGSRDAAPADHFVRITADVGAYNLIVTRGAGFSIEAVDGSDAPQEISGLDGVLGHVRGPRTSAPGAAAGGRGEETSALAGDAEEQTVLLAEFGGLGAYASRPTPYRMDKHLAAGPDHLVAVLDNMIGIYDKAGSLLHVQDLQALFGPLQAMGSVFKPVVTYDADARRFVVGAFNEHPPRPFVTDFLYAVSDTTDPLDGFSEMHRFTFEPGQGAQLPKVGWNADAHVFSFDMTGPGQSKRVDLLSIDKATVLDADPGTLAFNLIAGAGADATMAVATLHDALPGDPMWFVQESTPGGGSTLRIVRMDGVLEPQPTFTAFDVPVTPYERPWCCVPTGCWDEYVDIGTSSMGNAEQRMNRLVTAHSVHGSTDTAVRWYEFDTSGATPVLAQQGEIDPGPGVHAYAPAIAINQAGDLGLTFTQSAIWEFPSMYATGQGPGNAPGTMRQPVRVRASDLAGWSWWLGDIGDYTGIAVDPRTDTFWAVQYVAMERLHTPPTWIGAFSVSEGFDDDWYEIQANAGDVLNISTATPADGPFGFANDLDAGIQLYGPGDPRRPVASAAGTGNQALAYLAPATGTHRIRIFGEQATEGTYALRVTGATGPNPAPLVVETDPADGARLSAMPSTYALRFSEPVRADTIKPTDLQVNGIPGAAVRIVGTHEVEFTLDASVDVGDGAYTVSLPAGALTDLQGMPNIAYADVFHVDRTGPRIVATQWNGASFAPVISPGPLSVAVTFDEPLSTSIHAETPLLIADAEDVELVNLLTGSVRHPQEMSYDPANLLLRLSFTDPLAEGHHRLRLISGDGAFENSVGHDLNGELNGDGDGTPTGDGHPGGDYVIAFNVDRHDPIEPVAFSRLDPRGSLVSLSKANAGSISDAADTDDFGFFAEAGETIAAVAWPGDPALTLSLELPGSGTAVVAPAPGKPVVLPATAVSSTGMALVRVSADVGGAFGLVLYRNAALETGISDSDDGAELDLDPGLLELGSRRWAAVGRSAPDPVERVLFGVQPDQQRIVMLDPVTGRVLHGYPAPGDLQPGHTRIGLSMANGRGSLLYVNADDDATTLYRLDPATGTVQSTATLRGADYDGLSSEVGELQVATLYTADMDTDPAWTLDGGPGAWEYGVPLGLGSHDGDPTAGVTGTHVIGYNLEGDYPINMIEPAYATTPRIHTTGIRNVVLWYDRWLGVNSAAGHSAAVQVSNDGTTWQDVWSQNQQPVSDSSWAVQLINISEVADDQHAVYVRWVLGPTDAAPTYPGWNIDDVQVLGLLEDPPHVLLSDRGTAVTRLADFSGPDVPHVTALAPTNALGGDGTGRHFGLFEDGLIHAFDPAVPETLLGAFAPPAPDVEGMAYSGSTLYVSTASGDLFSLDPADGTILDVLPVTGGPLYGLGVYDRASQHGVEEAGPGLDRRFDLPDVDEFEITLAAGTFIDVVLAGQDGADYAGARLDLLDVDGRTVLATASPGPAPGRTPASNYDLGLLDFPVPDDGVYTIRLATPEQGTYALIVTEALAFDTEPNDDVAAPLRPLTFHGGALGHLDATAAPDSDLLRLDLTAGVPVTLRASTPFDAPDTRPLNDLDLGLAVFDPDGRIIASDDGDAGDSNAQLHFLAPATGAYVIRILAGEGRGDYVIEAEVLDDAGPRVTGVRVGRDAWPADFLEAANPPGLPAGIQGYAIPLGAADQLAPLPWSGMNQVTIVFDEPVIAGPHAAALSGAAGTPCPIASFTYDAQTHAATWTFDAELVTDRMLLTLGDAMTDAYGNHLDGEWSDGSSTISGDGTAGGDFVFRFNVTRSDVNQDGVTSIRDVAAMRQRLGAVAGSSAYAPHADLDGDGTVAGPDIQLLRARLGERLPDPLVASAVRLRQLPGLHLLGADDDGMAQTARDRDRITRWLNRRRPGPATADTPWAAR